MVGPPSVKNGRGLLFYMNYYTVNNEDIDTVLKEADK
jgi:hypothetical protein